VYITINDRSRERERESEREERASYFAHWDCVIERLHDVFLCKNTHFLFTERDIFCQECQRFVVSALFIDRNFELGGSVSFPPATGKFICDLTTSWYE